MTDLLLKRETEIPGDVYNVMCEERIVGRTMLSADHSSRGSGPSPTATTKTAHPPTATSQPARQPRWRSPRAGTGRCNSAGSLCSPDVRLGPVAAASHNAAMPDLLLRRASGRRPSAQWPDDYDVVGADG